MSAEIKSFYTKDASLINFYEVLDREGVAVWGGENQNEAIAFFSRDMLNREMVVTPWHSVAEDARPVGSSVNITALVLAAIAEGRSRVR